jgi:hypothetical protein
METPRAWFAPTAQGHTVIVRRYDSPGEPPSHQVSVYRGYLTDAPRMLPLPEGFPEAFSSWEDALLHACRQWHLTREAFQDVRLGRCVRIDFVRALREGTLGPLHPGMSAQALVALLGLPEAVTAAAAVVWFYGSVQLLLHRGSLQGLEIDRGDGDFTSLQLTGWFLKASTTKPQLERALTSRAVEYAEETLYGARVLRTPPRRPVFTFDFDAGDDERIHALYWNFPG